MPMRDDASYCRPRLYDADDPERHDDVKLTLDALERMRDEAMEDGQSETVYEITDLMKRIAKSAGGDYIDRVDGEAPEAGP